MKKISIVILIVFVSIFTLTNCEKQNELVINNTSNEQLKTLPGEGGTLIKIGTGVLYGHRVSNNEEERVMVCDPPTYEREICTTVVMWMEKPGTKSCLRNSNDTINTTPDKLKIGKDIKGGLAINY
ncbi:MAG: hypothetical protein LBV69_04590 [Bacteroidales bacterium]|jgi:hypothetical protein|nr:hypothetical protein [Bacteroidales bacterium]